MSIMSMLAALTGIWLLVSALALVALVALYAAERRGRRHDEESVAGELAPPASLSA